MSLASLRIALLHPTYWPEVRRGSERLIHDLGRTLAERGHEVSLITTHPHPTTVDFEDGMRIIRMRRPRHRERFDFYEHHIANVPSVIRRVLRGRYDLVHAFFPADAWAAVAARRLGGPPVVYSFHGVPVREWLVQRRYRIEMIKAAAEGAAATTVLSSAAAETFRRYLQHRPEVLPGGVFTRDFAVEAECSTEPTVFCAASLGDPRKRAEVLFAAFEKLRERRPDARLLLARTSDPVLSWKRFALPDGAEWVEVDRTPDLARAYASSSLSVLPAIHEAFGLVIVESLAAGTPVVAARSGACPEILDSEAIGRLFEPDDPSSLLEALEAVLELGVAERTVEACRSRAERYDWSRVIGDYEALYERTLDPRSYASSTEES